MSLENNPIFEEERSHLEQVQSIITDQLEEVDHDLNNSELDILQQKKYLWENFYDLDPEEVASNKQSISEEQDSYELRIQKKRLLSRLLENTYFGRVDFVYEDEDETDRIYIGLGGLRSQSNTDIYVYDWRAPISSMYYDYDAGKAEYDAPMGKVHGEITQKRQLKIRKGRLEYAFASEHNVNDEMLQKELASSGSTKMRNIVATIQKEQNTIIRDEKTDILVVQGVAGSGKTSIALHRIAYLLYRNRDSLHSGEVLIISPNKIFADYISNVLPELGEQNISEVSFDEIAMHEMQSIGGSFESKYEQMEYVIHQTAEDDLRLQAIRYKKGRNFLDELIRFAGEAGERYMQFSDVRIHDLLVKKNTLEKWFYTSYAGRPVFNRLELMAARIADTYESKKNIVISRSTRKEIRDHIFQAATTTDIIEIYEHFCDELDMKYGLESAVDRNRLLYEDVFPVILLKYLLWGKETSNYDRIKHVVIDEMQDYTMVQFALINLFFDARLTILGDVNQVVDKVEEQILDEIRHVFQKNVAVVKMMKSYRSSFEIGELCRKIGRLTDAESFERHGESPKIERCNDYMDMVAAIQKELVEVDLSAVTTAVVICKTAEEAQLLYDSLDEAHKEKIRLMNHADDRFQEGIMISNSYLVKGLEFDHVIVPSVGQKEYNAERDRQILYISCTRALHGLSLYYCDALSEFLSDQLCEKSDSDEKKE